eukprot:1320798-Prymnesium_polylepis.1
MRVAIGKLFLAAEGRFDATYRTLYGSGPSAGFRCGRPRCASSLVPVAPPPPRRRVSPRAA